MNSLIKGLLVTTLFINPLLIHASAPEWQIDPENSSLKFTATQNDSPLVGEFKKFSGEIFADPVNYKTSNIHITVDMNSLSASYGELVTTLTTPNWFNVKVFPRAEFKATDFNKTGDKSYQANGTLTIKDKSVPVTLNFTAEPAGKDKYTVEGSTTLKRTAFGVGQGEWSSTAEVKDDVKVDFKIVANRKT